MKQIAQYQDGRLEIQEVSVPVPPPGGALVRVTHSVISLGTEKMKVEQAKMNLVQKAMARPDQVRKVLETVHNLGWKSALQKVRNRMESPTPLGYSAAGVIVAVDAGNTRLRVGDRVACAGAECANHAEYIAMPDLLMAKIPEGVPGWMAAYTTVLSIALQAVRRGDAKLGDQVLVMAQGLIGLLVTALLHANGVRVMAYDLASAKAPFSTALGAEHFVAGGQDLVNEIRSWTNGYGVDKVFICTGTQSNKPIEQAIEVIRDHGRVVIVGNTKTDLSWKTYYEKEVEVRYSRSYGPGRYDPSYEWGGCDYPIGYVRWTEQRNMEACLALMAAGKLNLEAITTHRVKFKNSLAIYQDLLKPESKEVGVVLEYGEPEPIQDNAPTRVPAHKTTDGSGKLATPVTCLHVVGAGNFARTMLLPHLQGQIPFGVVVNQTALSAKHVKGKFGFQQASTNVEDVLRQGGRAAVVVAMRHHLHASIVRRALEAGLQVFVEKPLCLTTDELLSVDKAMEAGAGKVSVEVGFNRRFAPLSVRLKKVVDAAPGPKSAVYRVMAGKLDPKHWYANFAESGGRILGEACHFFDYFCWLFGSKPVRVFAQNTWPTEGRLPFPDSITAQVEFADGSSGQLIYSAEGDSTYPKERLTVFGAGFVGELDNYQRLEIYRKRKREVTKGSSKGHAEEMAAWVQFLRGEIPHPIPYTQARESMRLTFAALESIQQGRAVQLS